LLLLETFLMIRVLLSAVCYNNVIWLVKYIYNKRINMHDRFIINKSVMCQDNHQGYNPLPVGDISQYDLRNQIYYITVYLIVFLPFYYRDWFRTFVVIKSPTLLLPGLPIWATRWMSYKREEQLILRGRLGSHCTHKTEDNPETQYNIIHTRQRTKTSKSK
jgi:hypothetical protein